MAMKPWYNVVTPREDLREGKPLDASEFAVHLDYVRDGRAQVDYQNPERFFERTFLTKNLTLLAAEVLRRLSGETTETSAVFNMSTQFGGGKTHALTLLYHLAQNGPKANGLVGVSDLLKTARVSKVPQAETAIFVGTEFDALKGRGGDDGSPLRKTSWGEIAYQLGGNEGFAAVEEHDRKGVAPAGDVIRSFLPAAKSCLILMDEVMNFVSRNRKTGLATQFYDFLQNLSETARGQRSIVLVVSIPKSEVLEMSSEDEADYASLKHLLNRLGKAIAISSEHETSEIIRRRLFEWDLRHLTEDGRVLLSKEAVTTCNEYADWLGEHRQQIPNWFPIDDARNVFAATYPFHPLVLSVFERKWQTLPRFQQTRGMLRLLALWVSDTFQSGFKGAQRDGLIGVGTAPLHDSLFRRAVFEQLGEEKLEAAITTDITGKSDSFALCLDQEAIDNIKKARLHQKIATAIFFESSGGQQQKEATLPEIRLAVGEPALDVGNIETVLEELTTHCYYLRVEKNRYKFSLTPNLNKLLSDRRASILQKQIDERVREEVQLVFRTKQEIDHIFFPERSNQIPDKPALRLVVLAPDKSINESETLPFIEQVTKECGSSGRTYKSGLIWAVPDSSASLNETARNLLAWGDINIHDKKQLDESQQRQLAENLKRAQRDLNEAVWRTYKNIGLLDRENKIRMIDLGLIHSSAGESLTSYILFNLKQYDEVVPGVSPNFLVKNWPPALKEWSTKSVRDAFYASPLFPRLLNAEVLKETICRGVANGVLAYVGKSSGGKYEPFYFETQRDPLEIEFSDDFYIITEEEARRSIEPSRLKYLEIKPESANTQPGKSFTFTVKGLDQHGQEFPIEKVEWGTTGGEIDDKGVFRIQDEMGEYVVSAKTGGLVAQARIVVNDESCVRPSPPKPDKTKVNGISWSGDIPPQKWMNFYTKVVKSESLKLRVNLEAADTKGLTEQQIEEIRLALRELGFDDQVESIQREPIY